MHSDFSSAGTGSYIGQTFTVQALHFFLPLAIKRIWRNKMYPIRLKNNNKTIQDCRFIKHSSSSYLTIGFAKLPHNGEAFSGAGLTTRNTNIATAAAAILAPAPKGAPNTITEPS